MGAKRIRALACTCWLLFGALAGACSDLTPTSTAIPTTAPLAPTALALSPSPTLAPSAVPASPTAPPPVARPAAPITDSAFQAGPCPFREPVVPETTCGKLTVPEDHQHPNGRVLTLAVAIFKSTGDHPAADPIVYLDGGPGNPTLATIPGFFAPAFYPLLPSRDVILFDQRGIGFSDPALDCPEVDAAGAGLMQQGVRGSTEPGLLLSPLLACRDRLVKAGVDLAAYNTVESAADLEDLRRALGYTHWNLFGLSYGTRLALTAMRDFPAGIRSVILDSPIPLQASIADDPANSDRAFNELFAACASDAGCHRSWPSLKQVFYAVVDQLNAKPSQLSASLGRPLTFTGDALISALARALAYPKMIPTIPQAIYGARDGDLLAWMPFAEPSSGTSLGMAYSFWCADQVLFSGREELTAADQAYPQQHHLFSHLDDLAICQ